MLEGVDRDRPLARLGVVVGRAALPLLVGSIARLAEAGTGDLLGRETPRRVHLGQLEVGGARLVVGHRPADDHRAARGLGRGSLLDLARELVHVGRHVVAHAHPGQIAHATGRDVDHARLGAEPVELGHDAEGGGELVAARQRVQERGVHRVHAVVLHLQPVARQRELGRRHQGVPRHVEGIVEWKRGPSIGRAQVREHEAAELVGRIGALPHALAEPAARGLARRLQAPPVDVEDPAVVAAAQPALERDAELERGPAVRAVQMQDAGARAPVAEDHQVLAEDAHAARWPVEIARERDRLPESPEIFAARGAGTDRRELGIGRRGAATSVPVVCTTGRSRRGHWCASAWGQVAVASSRLPGPPGGS